MSVDKDKAKTPDPEAEQPSALPPPSPESPAPAVAEAELGLEPGKKLAWTVDENGDHHEIPVPEDTYTVQVSNTFQGELVTREYIQNAAGHAVMQSIRDVKDYDSATIRSVALQGVSQALGPSVSTGLNILHPMHQRPMLDAGWVPIRPHMVPESARDGLVAKHVDGLGQILMMNDVFLVAKPAAQREAQIANGWGRYNQELSEAIDAIQHHDGPERTELMNKLARDTDGELSMSSLGNISFGNSTLQTDEGLESLTTLDGIMHESEAAEHIASINRDGLRGKTTFGNLQGTPEYNKIVYPERKPNWGFKSPS